MSDDVRQSRIPLAERTTQPPPDSYLWSAEPTLRYVPHQSYQGRVFVEVWDQSAQVVMTGKNTALLSKALAALNGQHLRVPTTQEHSSASPATGQQAGQTFLGRLVIEVWNSQSVVSIVGSDSDAVLARSVHELASLTRSH